MARNDLGHWAPGTSGNPGGRPKPPDGLRTRLADLSPIAIDRLGELLDSADERVRLEAAKTILDRHLGRPAIQADISLHRAEADGHIAALLKVARRRALEPIVLEDVEVETIEPLLQSRYQMALEVEVRGTGRARVRVSTTTYCERRVRYRPKPTQA